MSNPISINIIPVPHRFQEFLSPLMHAAGQQHTDNTLTTVLTVTSVLWSCPDWRTDASCSLRTPSREIILTCLQLCQDFTAFVHWCKLIDYWKDAQSSSFLKTNKNFISFRQKQINTFGRLCELYSCFIQTIFYKSHHRVLSDYCWHGGEKYKI